MDQYDTSQLTEFPRFEPESSQSGVSTFFNKLWKFPIFSPGETSENNQNKAPTEGKEESAPSEDANKQEEEEKPEQASYAVEFEGRSLQNVLRRISSLVALGSSSGTKYSDTELARYWMPDDISRECYECAARFAALRRRHHCRVCGQVFCGRCCSQRVPGQIFGCAGGLRVCNYCCSVVLTYLREKEAGEISPDLRSLQESLQAKFPDNKALAKTRDNYMFAREEERGGTARAEPLAELLPQLRRALPTQQHRYRLVRYNGVWRGSDVMQWIMDNTSHKTRAQARVVCQALVAGGWLGGVPEPAPEFADYALYRPRGEEPRPEEEQKRITESVSSYCLDLDLGESSARLTKTPKTSAQEPKSSPSSEEETPNLENSEGFTEGSALCPRLAAKGQEHLELLMRQWLAASALSAAWLDVLAALCEQAAAATMPDMHSNDIDIRNYVQVKKLADGHMRDSCLVPGVVLTKNVAHRGMPQEIENPTVLLLDCSIAYQRVEGKLTSLEPVLLQEQEYLVRCAARIKALCPNVVLVRGAVARPVQDALRAGGIALATGVGERALKRLARSLRADLVASVDARIAVPRLGSCKRFAVTTYGSKTLMSLEGCAEPQLGCCLLLRGAPVGELARVKRVVRFMLRACYNWKLERAFLADVEATLPDPGAFDSEHVDDNDDSTAAVKDADDKCGDLSADDVSNDVYAGVEVIDDDKFAKIDENVVSESVADIKTTNDKASIADDKVVASEENLPIFDKNDIISTDKAPSTDDTSASNDKLAGVDKIASEEAKPEDPLQTKFSRSESERASGVPIRDFSDPLRAAADDDDVFLAEDSLQADTSADRWSTDDAVLSMSPSIVVPAPYLDTPLGRRCPLRRYFPRPLLPPPRPATPRVARRAVRTRSVVSLQVTSPTDDAVLSMSPSIVVPAPYLDTPLGRRCPLRRYFPRPLLPPPRPATPRVARRAVRTRSVVSLQVTSPTDDAVLSMSPSIVVPAPYLDTPLGRRCPLRRYFPRPLLPPPRPATPRVARRAVRTRSVVSLQVTSPTDDAVLSMSPSIVVPAPYLDTPLGRRCPLRRYFPRPLLPPPRPATPRVARRAVRTRSVVSLQVTSPTDDAVLSMSPSIVVPAPYLDTPLGRRCPLRRYFPRPLLPPPRPATPRVARRAVRTRSVVSLQKQHPFVTQPITSTAEDPALKASLAHYRATGCQLEDKHRPECPMYKPSVIKRVVVEPPEEPEPPAPEERDPLNPEHHQQLSVLLYSYSSKSANVPDFCVNPWIVTMEMYGKNDITLGAFLDKYCFNSESKCPSGGCAVPVNQHVRRFVHGDACITITCNVIQHSSIDKHKEEPNRQVMFWSRCEQCGSSSRARRLSRAALCLSLATYLRVRACSRSVRARACRHALHARAHVFARHERAACVRYMKITPYEIELPPDKIATHYDTRAMRDALIAQLNELVLKGHETLSAVAEAGAEQDYAAFKHHTEQISLALTHAKDHNTAAGVIRSLWRVSDALIAGERMLRDAHETWATPAPKPAKMADAPVEEKSDLEESTGESENSEAAPARDDKEHPASVEEDEEKGDNKKTVRQILSQLLSNKEASHQNGIIISHGLVPVVVQVGEVGSVIAAALASVAYHRSLQAHRHSTQSEADETEAGKDRTDGDKKTKSNDHIEVLLKDGLLCCIYFAPQFHRLRHALLASLADNQSRDGDAHCCDTLRDKEKSLCDIEEGFIRALAHCVPWEAKGGKSGSTFSKTKDDRYVLKEMTKPEWQQFLLFAPHYFSYITSCRRQHLPSLLARIVGVYSVGGAGNGVLVMENVWYRRAGPRFDLKGSSRHRLAAPAPLAVLLDENLLWKRWDQQLFVASHTGRVLFACVDRDTEFLAANSVMDYSLLLGIDGHKLVLGVVDYIRTFTWDKKLEALVKEKLGSGQPTVVSPAAYRERLRKAARKYFLRAPDVWDHLFRDRLS